MQVARVKKFHYLINTETEQIKCYFKSQVIRLTRHLNAVGNLGYSFLLLQRSALLEELLMECKHLFACGLATLAVLLTSPSPSRPQAVPIAVDPPSLSWELVSVGSTTAEKDVAFHNATDATVTFKSITISGGDYAIAVNTDKKCGSSVPAKSWCLVGVTFSPTSLGTRTGTLTFVYDAANSPLTIPLSGTGSGPLTVSPIGLAFGSLRVGLTSSRRLLTITNRQTTAFNLSAPSATGDFAITRTNCGTSIGPGQRCLVEATFTPTSAGPRTGQLSLPYGTPNPSLVANLTGTGTTTGLTVARHNSSATLLDNGQVLVAGGSVCTPFCSPLATAELYNPATQTFTATGGLSGYRGTHTATLLKNGMVLLAGGEVSGTSLATAELYDPATGTFTATGNLNVPRHNHTATLLNDGTVLIAGGSSRIGRNPPTKVPCAELYDPAAKSFKLTGCLGTARDEHTATLLDSGKVLIAGGNANPPGGYLASAELYDPATSAFTPAGMMGKTRSLHTATLLKNGMVLIAGGADPTRNAGAIADAELYNPESGAFVATGKLQAARYRTSALLLNTGAVLLSGGGDEQGYLSSAEVYNPTTQTFVATGTLKVARLGHKSVLLKDGTVLAVAGQGEDGDLASAELYDPATGTFAVTR